MLFYIKILKDFANQNQIDNAVCNFNFISFIAMIILFIINLLYVSLTSALKAEIDFNEQSPSDYILLVSDIPVEKTDIAFEELNTIREELKNFSPDKVVWDIDDLFKQPPWGKNISEDITDLSNYFVTSEGEDFISVLFTALNDSKEMKAPVEIVSL